MVTTRIAVVSNKAPRVSHSRRLVVGGQVVAGVRFFRGILCNRLVRRVEADSTEFRRVESMNNSPGCRNRRWQFCSGTGGIEQCTWALFSVGKRVESTKCDASDEALTNRLAFDVCWPKIAKPLKHKRTKCGYHAKRKYKVPNEILAVKFVLRMRVRSLGRPAS